jgi:Type II secretory pathway, pullulanase PulA and related glycosidases
VTSSGSPRRGGDDGRGLGGQLRQVARGVLNGDAISEPDPRGGKITDASFLLLFNAHSKPLTFTLPEPGYAAGWEVVIDTASGVPGAIHPPKKEIEVRDHAVVVLRSTG